MGRKYFIDNLRIFCILLLFPFHNVMMYNDFGERWYVHIAECIQASFFNISVYAWWMPLLFLLAGMSTFYAFEKRTVKQYLMERLCKLYVPLAVSLLLVIPVQPYIADVFFNGYSGNYFQHYRKFFKLTDWSGYDGHFTPGHLWFVLYLFNISLAALPVVYFIKTKKFIIDFKGWKILLLIPVFFLPFLLKPLGNIGGKSFGEFGAWFLIGFFVFADENFQEKIKKILPFTAALFVSLIIARCFMYSSKIYGLKWDVLHKVFVWSGILFMFGAAKTFFDFNSRFTQYFARASFAIYVIHQSVIVILGFFAAGYFKVPYALQYFALVSASFGITVLIYEILKRFKLTCFLFGIKFNQ